MPGHPVIPGSYRARIDYERNIAATGADKTAKVTPDDFLELSIPERLAIIEDLWDSLAATPTFLPVTEEQRREMDNRLKEYEAGPQAGQSWARVREDILYELSEPQKNTHT